MMKRTRTFGWLALLLWYCMSAGVGCGHSAEPVRFSASWPSKAGDYEEASENWTRRGVLRAPLKNQASQLVELYATFLSTEWRAAYVERQSKLRRLSHAKRAELEDAQKQSASNHHEVVLLVTTYYPDHNDLHRERSIWTVALVDGQGNEIVAEEVKRDRSPRELVKAEFENFGDFAEAYRVRFPAAPELLNGKEFKLRMSSSLGMVEVAWQNQG